MIYNKDPVLVLWDALKNLDEIPIYKEVMDEDEDSTPESYILIRGDIANVSAVRGDGKIKVRRADCDITLTTKGIATNTTDLHNVNKCKVTAALESAGIGYSGYNLGYDDSIKSTQYTWNVTIYHKGG